MNAGQALAGYGRKKRNGSRLPSLLLMVQFFEVMEEVRERAAV